MTTLTANRCPFCNSDQTYVTSGGVTLLTHYYVKCYDCNARGPVKVMTAPPEFVGDPKNEKDRRRYEESWLEARERLKEEAILAWNNCNPTPNTGDRK